MFTNKADFIATGINALIANTESLYVLFATYNNVAGYKSGSVDTGREDLMIQVQSGDLVYSPAANLVYAVGTPLGKVGAEVMHEDACEAQSTLEAAIAIEPGENVTSVAVIYAGISAFEEVVDFIRRIKQDLPDTKVVLLTCNCDLQHKGYVLEPMLQNKELEAVVVTHECGGRMAMRDILDGFIAAWPNKVPAAASTDYVPKYACTVCGVAYPDRNVLTSSFDLPIFRKEDGVAVEGFTAQPSICESCLKLHGEPVKVLHRPRETDICVFSDGEEVVMLGSGPKDD